MTTVMAETVVNMDDPGHSLNDHHDNSDDDDDDDHSGEEGENKGKGKKGGGKSRRELPSGAVATLKAWLLSPEHFTHPYPTPQDQIMLMQKTGIDKKQLKNWFTNARRRIWKPMLKKQLEQGKLAQAGGGPGGAGSVTILNPQGTVPGSSIMLSQQPLQPTMADATQSHYPGQWQQQPAQGPATTQQVDNSTGASGPMPGYAYVTQYPPQLSNHRQQSSDQTGQQQQNTSATVAAANNMNPSNSIGSLPPISSFGSSGQMIKNDSHAVLMELFARDQDLVRQAAEGAKLKAQQIVQGSTQSPHSRQMQMQDQDRNSSHVGQTYTHPMHGATSTTMPLAGGTGSAPALNSWPHFSSVSSLNNLGSLAGVKSIQNLSAADLVNQANKKGSLAQIKSQESMGRADSYAFLEVFFDSDMANRRGHKREREEDNDIGLSLDGDEPSGSVKGPEVVSSVTRPAPLPAGDVDDSEELKRNYDDALAARGLLSVSRSREKLNEIPKKMQRTLSQEYLKQFSGSQWGYNQPKGWQHSGQDQQSDQNQQQQGHGPRVNDDNSSQRMQENSWSNNSTPQPQPSASMSNPNVTNDSVEVPVSTKCSICHQVNIDTQLLPCGHMFHGRCLKPSLQNAMGAPTCPVDHIPMQSAVLAIPTGGNCRSHFSQSSS